MRKSREEAAETRKRIVQAAARQFREKGIAATGLAELMKAAGLTHGGFYKHFSSKDQLVAEATAVAVDLYRAFPVKRLFWVVLTVFCSERERPFFVPSPGIRFAERAEGVKGPKR